MRRDRERKKGEDEEYNNNKNKAKRMISVVFPKKFNQLLCVLA